MSLLNIVLFTVLIATAYAKVADFVNCDEASEDVCKISEVRIVPCKKSSKCLFHYKENANLAFDFTPNFAASKLKSEVYWANGAVDLPFQSQGSNDGCQYTSCPLEAGKQQTHNFNLYVSPKLPSGTFTIKWKLWNDELSGPDVRNGLCCFKTTISIRK